MGLNIKNFVAYKLCPRTTPFQLQNKKKGPLREDTKGRGDTPLLVMFISVLCTLYFHMCRFGCLHGIFIGNIFLLAIYWELRRDRPRRQTQSTHTIPSTWSVVIIVWCDFYNNNRWFRWYNDDHNMGVLLARWELLICSVLVMIREVLSFQWYLYTTLSIYVYIRLYSTQFDPQMSMIWIWLWYNETFYWQIFSFL